MTDLSWRNRADRSVFANETTPLPSTLYAAGGIPLIADQLGRLITGSDSELFFDQVDGTAVDTRKWLQSTTTMTITQGSGVITLNAAGITTANTNARISTIKAFQLYGDIPAAAVLSFSTNVGPQANATIEAGFLSASGGTAPTDGIFVRLANDATLKGVINFNGTETTGSFVNVATGLPYTWTTGVQHTVYVVQAGPTSIQLIIDSINVCVLSVPTNQPFSVSNSRMSIAYRVYTGATPPAVAPQVAIGRTNVAQGAYPMNRDWENILIMIGNGAYQSPVSTFAQTANHANSTDPVSATLSNTAAGYTTLGGKFQFAAVAGATTDYALFGYQVPIGYQLIVTSVAISSINLGAAVALSPTVLDWSIGLNSSAVSLATVDGAGTWAPRRIPISTQSFVVASGIGASVPDIFRLFPEGLVVDQGRFFHVILQMPVATATVSEIIRGNISITGWFE